MQGVPICWLCETSVIEAPVFDAPCGHEVCPSAVFHPLCLMEWREEREQFGDLIRQAYMP